MRSFGLALAGALLLAACQSQPSFDRSEAARSDRVGQISNSIGSADGQANTALPFDADGVGQSMRSASAQPPRP